MNRVESFAEWVDRHDWSDDAKAAVLRANDYANEKGLNPPTRGRCLAIVKAIDG